MANPRPWRTRPFDALLLLFLVYFLFGWLSSDLPTLLGIETAGVVLYQEQIDPFMAHPSPGAGFTMDLAALLYGPAYGVMAYAVARERPWAPRFVLPMAGMILRTTLVYMAASLASATPPLNLPAFLGLNGVYVVGPLLLIARYARSPAGGDPAA